MHELSTYIHFSGQNCSKYEESLPERPHCGLTYCLWPQGFFEVFHAYAILVIIHFLNYLFIYLFIFIFMAVLGLRFCARAFSSCGKWGPLFIAVRGPLTVAASLFAEHRLQTRRLSNCGSRA